MIRRMAVIGVGLIGGSFALALREAGMVEEVVGCGRSVGNLERAMELGIIDSFTHDVEEAVADADLVFVAVPLGSMENVFKSMQSHLKDDALITDGGSAKGSVVEAARAAFGRLPSGFVPGHPIAGTEQSGADAAFSSLYSRRRIILTPVEETSDDALAKVTALWNSCGAEVTVMDVDHHDEVLAATSHLPHMLAFSLVDYLAGLKENDEIFRYAAGGFRDFTRIASSNPVMWRDICLANRKHLGAMLENYAVALGSIADALHDSDGERLLQIFERAKSARDKYVDNA